MVLEHSDSNIKEELAENIPYLPYEHASERNRKTQEGNEHFHNFMKAVDTITIG